MSKLTDEEIIKNINVLYTEVSEENIDEIINKLNLVN